MAHDNPGRGTLHFQDPNLSNLGKPKGGERSMSVEEYTLTPISKEGHVNNGNKDDEDEEAARMERRHTLSSSFRYLRRYSYSRGHRLSIKHSHHTGPESPGTPGTPGTPGLGLHRRRSIAGTFITDPSLKLPPRPKAFSFSPDGRNDDTKDANGVYTVDGESAVKEEKSDYDPYCERIVDHPTTNVETLLHLLKGSLGTGILAMPNAFYHAGWALGVGGTIIIGMICTYCIHLLVTCEYELCRRRRLPALNYPSTAEAGLLEGPKIFNKMAPYAGHIINFFLLAYQLGICCVYVVFVASNVKDVVDQYMDPMDVRIYMVIFLLPLILINYIRNLKYLAPFSSLANVITFVGFGITLYYVFDELPGIGEREPVGNIAHWPLFFGTVLFSLEAIGVIMPLENEMKTPRSFGGPVGVLNQAMVSIIFLYVGMGFFGYLKYGSGSLGSITLNIPQDEVLAQSVKIMMAFAIYITHSLQCYVAVDITWNGYLASKLENSPHKLFYEFAVRTLLVLFTFLVAEVIPNLEFFISLIGACCISLLALAFPAILETSTFWYNRTGKARYFMCIKNFLLVCFSLLGLSVVLLAVAIPNLELFISLIGALCLSALGVAFPAIIQQSTYWYQYNGTQFYLMSIKNIAIVLFGILGLVVGTYTSLNEIVHTFLKS